MFSQLHTLEVKWISIADEDDADHGFQQLESAIKTILGFSGQLQNIVLERLGIESLPDKLDMDDLFSRYHGQMLRQLDLSDLETEAGWLTEFIRAQASTLGTVILAFINLNNGTWSSVLTDLRASEFPALKTLRLQECFDDDFTDLCGATATALDYVLRRTDDNPLAIEDTS